MSDGSATTADERPQRRSLLVTISPGTAIAAVSVVVATFALWSTLQAARSILGMALASAIVALLVAGPVDSLGRHMPRAVALLLVLVVGLGGLGAVGYSVYDDVDRAFDRLQREAPRAAARLERSDRFGELATDLRLEERVRSAVEGVRDEAQDRARSTAFRAANYFVATILMIFLVVYGGRIFEGGLRQIGDPQRRTAVDDIAGRAVASARAYLGLELANAVVLGVTTGVVFHNLDLPGASALALLVALGSIVPDVGVVVGGVPALLLIAASEPFSTLLVVTAGLVALQLVEALYAHRILVRQLEVGSAITLLSFLMGYGLYGVAGAIFAVAIAVIGSAVLDATGSVLGDDAADEILRAAEQPRP